MSSELERRYRRVLRLLPGYYRQQWEEDMVAAFLDSSLTGDPEEDEFIGASGRPSFPEIASVVALAARLYLGGTGAPRRYFTWGQAVRDAVLVVVLARAAQALGSFALLAGRHHVLGFAVPPALLAGGTWDSIWAGTWYAVGYAWIVGYIALVLGYRRTAQVIVGLAIVPDLIYLLQYPGPWAGWLVLDLAPVLAMAAFHENAPPVVRRRWLLALPVSFVLVVVPVIALQASGDVSWLDQPGLCCILVTLGCLAHAVVTRGSGSREWSLTLILLAAATSVYQISSLIAHPQLLTAGIVELVLMAAAVAVDGHSLIAAWKPLDLRPARLLALLAVAVAIVALGAAGRWHVGTTTGGRTTHANQATTATIVVTAMVSEPQTPVGNCPAGYAKISVPGVDDSDLCFRQDAAPVTFTPAEVTNDGSLIIVTVPASEAEALSAVTTTAYDAAGFTSISVDGKIWQLRRAVSPLTKGQFPIQIPDKNAANELLRILVPSA
jgi:hypothetical protein